jgi:hypothetical protein
MIAEGSAARGTRLLFVSIASSEWDTWRSQFGVGFVLGVDGTFDAFAGGDLSGIWPHTTTRRQICPWHLGQLAADIRLTGEPPRCRLISA